MTVSGHGGPVFMHTSERGEGLCRLGLERGSSSRLRQWQTVSCSGWDWTLLWR